MKRYLILCLPLALAGCVLVPRTTITGSFNGHPWSISSPKDSDLDGLEIEAFTNGTVKVKLQHLHTKMNPDVITTTGNAQAQLITATGDAVMKSLGTAAAAAVASSVKPPLMAAPPHPPVPTPLLTLPHP